MNLCDRFSGAVFCFWVLAAVGTGCAGNTASSAFYLLESAAGPPDVPAPAHGGEPVSVLLGPISLPSYLQRTQIVSRAGRNRLRIDEFHRWGEPLPDGFYRVLAENLATRLATDRIARYDRGGGEDHDYQVAVDVTRFDTAPDGTAVLAAFWTLYGRDGRMLEKEMSVLRAPSGSAGVEASVAALNETLAALSREIAEALRNRR